jgi:transposase-like protein
MTAPHIVDPVRLLGQALGDASPDLMRHLLATVINALLSADADAVCGAEWGRPSPDRVAQRNGYRHRGLDTRVGTIDVAIPKLRQGAYFPEWLLERRKRAEAALISVVATCYLLGVSTRRMDKLAATLGIDSLSKSQVSRMAADLDAQVAAFRTRSLADAGPFTFVAADALTMKVRENRRVVNAVVLIATGVDHDGYREVLGVQVATSETREAWNVFFADLVARGLHQVILVTSDAHAGLVEAIAANLPGAAWQRCRTHYAANLMSVRPKASWGAVKAMLHSVYDQPDAASVHAQYDKYARHPRRQATCRGRPPRRSPRRRPRVHRVPQRDLATDLEQQPQRTPQQREPPPHRRRRHLPRPQLDHPPGRRGPGRATRRIGRRAPPPRPRRAGPLPHPTRPDRHHHRDNPSRTPGDRSMTRKPKTLAQSPGYTQAEYLATLAAGYETGWWDEHGIPAPWPDDFPNPNSGWHCQDGNTTYPLKPGEQPF